MKFTWIAAAAFAVAGVSAASAQDARSAGPDSFLSVSPFANSPLYSGRSAYEGGGSTSRTYGMGPDGQGVLAPHINGIF